MLTVRRVLPQVAGTLFVAGVAAMMFQPTNTLRGLEVTVAAIAVFAVGMLLENQLGYRYKCLILFCFTIDVLAPGVIWFQMWRSAVLQVPPADAHDPFYALLLSLFCIGASFWFCAHAVFQSDT